MGHDRIDVRVFEFFINTEKLQNVNFLREAQFVSRVTGSNEEFLLESIINCPVSVILWFADVPRKCRKILI